MKPKIKISNIIGHFKTIIIHKYWVGRYCFLAGLYWRGIKHDISKFSPTEFFESVRYYTGERSPINVCKEINGISYSWLHHKARNDHHYLYWQDNFDPIKYPHVHMPYKPLVESICDSLGAARTYLGDGFSYYKEYKWYFNELDNMAMNDTDKRLALYTVFLLAFIEEKYGYVDPVKIRKVFKKYLYEAYNNGLKHQSSKLWKYFYDHTIILKTFVDCSINKELEADKRYYDYTLSKLYEEEREEVLFNER